MSLCLLLLAGTAALAAEDTLTFGGKNGWKKNSYAENVTVGKGRYGYDSIMLKETSLQPELSTDLLLTFENGKVIEETGHYLVDADEVYVGNNAAKGNRGALFRSEVSSLSLTGGASALFGNQGLTDSFSIEFWICPLAASNGEMLLSWRSSRNLDYYSLYQDISVLIYNGSLRWNFTNIFDILAEENSSYALLGKSRLIPGSWSHHQLTYDEDTGMLEYKMNGVTEDILYITDTAQERGSVFSAHLGVPASLNICPSYTGWLDDFCIRRNCSVSDGVADLYPSAGGRFETEPFSLGDNGSRISCIEAISTVPEETGVEYFIRSAENPYNWTADYPEWKSFIPGQALEDVEGVWYQLAADLYPDGACSVTPSVSELTVHYQENEKPAAPFNLKAVPGNGCVELSWSGAAGNEKGNTAGYIVYYGSRPGEYLGKDSDLGSSPVYVGNVDKVTVTGLENGKIYYFAVAGVSESSPRITGPSSSEVYARPLGRYQIKGE